MAPTAALAEQRVFPCRQLLEPLGVPVTLLTSSLKPRERAARRAGIAAGDVACVVGTHALVQEGVEFRRLGLAVVDRKSTRLNSSHVRISYAVFCLKKKNSG